MRKISNFSSTVLILILSILLTCFNGCSEKEQKVYHVGVLTDYAPFIHTFDSFKAGMTELGYIEGKNIFYDVQVKDSDTEGQKAAVKQFVKDKVDFIFTFPTEATVIAYNLTQDTNIPVLFAMCGIEGNFPVKDVRQPGINLTGVRFPGPDNVVKHLELMLEIKPQTKRIWGTYDPDYPNTIAIMEALRNAIGSYGVEFIEEPNSNIDDVREDLSKLEESGKVDIDAILLLPEGLSQSPDVSALIIEFATRHNIPVGGGLPFTLELGAVFSFLPDTDEMGKLASLSAHKILNGIPAGTIPLITPENYLYVNYKAIQSLGLTSSEGLLHQAKEIVR